jgi:hypothetical protein
MRNRRRQFGGKSGPSGSGLSPAEPSRNPPGWAARLFFTPHGLRLALAQHDPAYWPDKRISGHVIAAAMMTSVATIMPIRMPISTVR